MTTWLVPAETAQNLERYLGSCQNLKLILARYIPEEVISNETYDARTRQKWRDRWLRVEILPRFDSAGNRQAEWIRLAEAEYIRWQAMTATAQQFNGQLQGRLLVGHGGKGVLEFGLTLSHVTGLPVIPGSALKGLARAYGLFTIAAELTIPTIDSEQLTALDTILASPDRYQTDDKELNKALGLLSEKHQTTPEAIIDIFEKNQEATLWRLAFGNQTQAGICIFHDAVIKPPLPPVLFEADVMTPHFKDYYDAVNKESPDYARAPAPHDGQNPNPILFLTVAARTQFAFAVGLRKSGIEGATDAQALAAQWLKKGLYELGVGAKTAAGYGVFSIM